MLGNKISVQKYKKIVQSGKVAFGYLLLANG